MEKINELKNYIIGSSAPREEKNVMLMILSDIIFDVSRMEEHLATRAALEESREPNHSV